MFLAHAVDIAPLDFLSDPPCLIELSVAEMCGRNARKLLDFNHHLYAGDHIMDNRLEDLGKEIGQRAKELVGEDAGGQEYFEAVEMLAIETLDSRFMDFEPGALEDYLLGYLEELRRRLGLD